jgi:hypothetical protein
MKESEKESSRKVDNSIDGCGKRDLRYMHDNFPINNGLRKAADEKAGWV